MKNLRFNLSLFLSTFIAASSALAADPHIGVGAKPLAGAEVLLDGSRKMLDEKWTYWEGPRFAAALPIKWQIVPDPVDLGNGPFHRRSGGGGRQIRRGGHRYEKGLSRFPAAHRVSRNEARRQQRCLSPESLRDSDRGW